jgi:hypothetical protein
MITARGCLLDEAQALLAEAFGPVDEVSATMPFDFTHYYDGEMGSPLLRRFVAFRPLASPSALADIKLATNAIEARMAADAAHGGPSRPVNLDPGYVEQSKLVLASMKDFAHRVYLRDGVYGEVTLLYRGGRWESLPWTFPDFASGRYDAFLTAARQRLREVLKESS